MSKMDELRHKDPELYRLLLLKSGGKAKETSSDTDKMMDHDAYKRVKGRVRRRGR